MKIHLKDAASDRLSLCRVWPGKSWVLEEALPRQAAGAVCLTCAKTAAKRAPDEEECRLLTDLENCRAEELVTADRLSNPCHGVLSSAHRELVDALAAIRLRCHQKSLTYRAYRQKMRDHAR